MTTPGTVYERSHTANLIPPDPATSRAKPLSAARPASIRHNPADTKDEVTTTDRRQLLTVEPPSWLYEQGAHLAPKSCFFICHTMRSGSTLLCDALSSTGVAGHAEEYFPERSPTGEVYMTTGAALRDPATWQCDWTSTPFGQCLDRVLRCGTTPSGVFASKLRWFNMRYLGEMLGALPEPGGLSLYDHLDRLFPNLRYVWVTRRDKVRQAVSLVRAKQSHQWIAMSSQTERSEAADYNFYLVESAVRRFVDEECAWEGYFTHSGITPFTVVYEDLVRNYESTVRQLLDYLQIGLPTKYENVFPTPRLHKQADAVSEEWVERYYRDLRSSPSWHMVASLPALLLRRRLREAYVLPRMRRQIDHSEERRKS